MRRLKLPHASTTCPQKTPPPFSYLNANVSGNEYLVLQSSSNICVWILCRLHKFHHSTTNALTSSTAQTPATHTHYNLIPTTSLALPKLSLSSQRTFTPKQPLARRPRHLSHIRLPPRCKARHCPAACGGVKHCWSRCRG